MPLWFLAAYLAAQLNLPWLAALHSRAPWLTLAGLITLVVTVDCLRGVMPPLAYLNMVFVWCAVQQLGFIVADGERLQPGRPAYFGIMAASNMLLGLIVLLGLYSGNMLVNLNPPNVTLLLLGISQAAALQLFRPGLSRVASLAGVRRTMGVAGRRSITVYLWHLPLLAAMSGLLLLTDFPQPAGGSAAWWWARPLVLMGVVALLLPVLALFGRLEERPTASGPSRSRPAAAVLLAAVAVFVPAVDAALNGLTLGLLGGGAACFALAVVLLGRIPARLTTPAGRPGGSVPAIATPAIKCQCRTMTENSATTEDTFTPDVSTVRNDELHRYELRVGGKLAVQVRFIDRPGHIDFIHTDTAEQFQGQGLAKVLAHFALDDVVASGKRIIPNCPFMYRYLRKHESYHQYVDWPERVPEGA